MASLFLRQTEGVANSNGSTEQIIVTTEPTSRDLYIKTTLPIYIQFP